jgi:hypothetical protein
MGSPLTADKIKILCPCGVLFRVVVCDLYSERTRFEYRPVFRTICPLVFLYALLWTMQTVQQRTMSSLYSRIETGPLNDSEQSCNQANTISVFHSNVSLFILNTAHTDNLLGIS